MLLACLQRHAERLVSIHVNRDAYQAARHVAFQLVPGGEKSRVRTAVAHGDAKPLVGTEDDVSPPFSGRCQKGETHQVSAYAHEGSGTMNLLNQFAVVTYLS